jgi:hypothetical protein
VAGRLAPALFKNCSISAQPSALACRCRTETALVSPLLRDVLWVVVQHIHSAYLYPRACLLIEANVATERGVSDQGTSAPPHLHLAAHPSGQRVRFLC